MQLVNLPLFPICMYRYASARFTKQTFESADKTSPIAKRFASARICNPHSAELSAGRGAFYDCASIRAQNPICSVKVQIASPWKQKNRHNLRTAHSCLTRRWQRAHTISQIIQKHIILLDEL